MILDSVDDWYSKFVDEVCLKCKYLKENRCSNYPFYSEGCPVYKRKCFWKNVWTKIKSCCQFFFKNREPH